MSLFHAVPLILRNLNNIKPMNELYDAIKSGGIKTGG